MGMPGKAVVVEGGKRGVATGGKRSVYNADEQCPACCVEFTQSWSFTDSGFIDGGQDGAFREYAHPDDVAASPWSIFDDGQSLRLDWEDDDNCQNHNPYTQNATATAAIVVPRDMVMTVTWSGQGETQDSNFELMSLSVDGQLVGEAHAPGGSQGCAGGMAPVVSDPEPPQEVTLLAGEHTLNIDATTNDDLYHFGAWYQFELAFADLPEAP